MKCGIAGLGIVGGALKHFFEQNQTPVLGYDPAIPGYQNPNVLLDARLVFICVPAPTMSQGGQDLTEVRKTLEYVHPEAAALVRTTILPGTADMLAAATGKRVAAFPEFLTERTAKQDIMEQPMICGMTGANDDVVLMATLFGPQIAFANNKSVEMAKFIHNVYCAHKVNFFNHVHTLCAKAGIEYDVAVHMANLPTGFIGPHHTQVPGPDGKFGYGGKCFPKDVAAMASYAHNLDARLFENSLRLLQIDNTFHRMREA